MDPCTTCDTSNNLCEIVPKMAIVFKALGDRTRLQIIYLLTADTTGTLGVSDIANHLGISQPAVSQHLKTLKNAGIVDSRRDGFYIYYTINRDHMVEFHEQFELMYTSVMDKCNREMIRKETRDQDTRALIIFYSYSGITRRIAEGIRNVTGCDLIEIQTKKPYTSFTVYTKGVIRSRKMAWDEIEQEDIDVSEYDLLIIGTPVWAWKPAPAINAAIGALSGCEGKRAVIFTTCSNQPGEALPIMNNALTDRGVRVKAEISLTADDTKKPDASGELLRRIMQADPFSDMHGENARVR